MEYQGYLVEVCEEVDLTGAEPAGWSAMVKDHLGSDVYQSAPYPTREMAQADAMAWIDGRIRLAK